MWKYEDIYPMNMKKTGVWIIAEAQFLFNLRGKKKVKSNKKQTSTQLTLTYTTSI